MNAYLPEQRLSLRQYEYIYLRISKRILEPPNML